MRGRSAFKMLAGKPTGKRPLGRPRRRREDNIIMNLEEVGVNNRNLVDSTQDRDYWRPIVNAALNFRIPQVIELASVLYCCSYKLWRLVCIWSGFFQR